MGRPEPEVVDPLPALQIPGYDEDQADDDEGRQSGMQNKHHAREELAHRWVEGHESLNVPN